MRKIRQEKESKIEQTRRKRPQDELKQSIKDQL
jgi:hypothetical protein